MNIDNIPIIDLKATGNNIKYLIEKSNYTIKELQYKFGFATPQSIYKWIHGTSLPTVDNLVILSKILNTSMDDIIKLKPYD